MESNFREFYHNPTSSLNYTYNSAIDNGRNAVLKHRREAIQIELEKERVREKILSDRLRVLEAELRRELVREHGGFPSPLALGQPHRFEPDDRRFIMRVQERFDDIGGVEDVPISQRSLMELSFREFNSDHTMRYGLRSRRDMHLRETILLELEKEITREKILAHRLRVLQDELIIQHTMTSAPITARYEFELEMPRYGERYPRESRYDDGRRHRCDVGGFEAGGFRRLPRSEVIGPGKLSGSKRKVLTPPIKDFRCVLCQISVTSARTMKEHISGRKHQAELAARQQEDHERIRKARDLETTRRKKARY